MSKMSNQERIGTMTGRRERRTWSPRFLAALVAMSAACTMLGLVMYTFVYAKEAFVSSSDPTACINCHIMEEQYHGWTADSFQWPPALIAIYLTDNIVHKYFVKAENGFYARPEVHDRMASENIEARDVSLAVTNEACLYCHADITSDMRHLGTAQDGEIFDCVRCHAGIGHE